MGTDAIIHGVGYGSHGDIQLKCGPWTAAAWKQPKLPEGIYKASYRKQEYLYTFDADKVPCDACLNSRS